MSFFRFSKFEEGIMLVWKYIIKSPVSTIITKNSNYAEEKSKLGYTVYCRREKNIYKVNRC